MGKFLRVMVVLFFLLSIVALVFGIMLFNKRELVKQRTQQLETYIQKLALTIEAEGATGPRATLDYPARDESGVTAQEADRFDAQPDLIQRSRFWDNYDSRLEEAQKATIVFTDDMKRALMQFYQVDAEGNPVLDAQGFRRTTGPGTMAELLDGIVKRATEQQGQLDATRQLLRVTRDELIDTIKILNTRLADLRKANQTIRDRDNTITRLNGQIRQLENQVSALNATIRQKDDEIAQLNVELAEKIKEVQDLEEENTELKKTNDRLRGELDTVRQLGRITAGAQVARAPMVATITLDPGIKGSVLAVNSEYNFVIVQLMDSFVAELRSAYAAEAGGLPSLEFMVIRKGTQEFVTKIRMIQLRDTNLAICNIIPEWQQLPVEIGDDVVLQ